MPPSDAEPASAERHLIFYGLDVEIRLKWTPLGVRTHLVGVPLLLCKEMFQGFGSRCLDVPSTTKVRA